MKETIKNSLIGAFAIFGFVALISSSNTEPTVIHDGTPESHVWELRASANPEGTTGAYMWNKETGEVRKVSRHFPGINNLGMVEHRGVVISLKNLTSDNLK